MADENGDKALATSPKRVRDVLTRGRTMADQLQAVISEIVGCGSGSPPPSTVVEAAELLAARSLVGKIADTFTRSILMIDEDGEDSRISPVVDSSTVRKLEDSGDSGKRPAAQKDRRGCYKRRRSQKTYTKDTPDLFQDGYGWRKYGQKKILDSNHPRNYYRCTHKYDQDCKAKKHVQQIQENPRLYRTTYDGHHTCKNMTKIGPSAHQLLINNDHSPSSSSFLWNFQQQPYSYNISESIKQGNANATKYEAKRTPSPLSDYNNDGYNGCYYISPEVLDNEDDQPLAADHGDVNSNTSEVYSCTASTHDDTMGHDMMNGGVDSVFDELFMDGLISYRG